MIYKTKFAVGDTAYVFSIDHFEFEKREYTIDAIIVEKGNIAYRCSLGKTQSCCTVISEKNLHYEIEDRNWLISHIEEDIERAERELEFHKERKEKLLNGK